MLMTYEEIANEISLKEGKTMTKQNIAQTAKRALRKIYNNCKEICPELEPHEIILELAKIYNINDIKTFTKSFPTDIKKVVMEKFLETKTI